MKRGFGGSMVAAKIWNSYMKQALEGSAVESFPALPENDAQKPVLRGSEGGKITLQVDKATGKIATSSTPAEYIEEKTFIQPHSILYYVKKDDPRGDAPENPASDPQYEAWEQGIQDWITRNKEANPDWNFSFDEPPTEYDDAHSLDLIPSMEVVYPTEGQNVYDRQLDTDIRFSAPRGVAKVSYKIDDVYVGVETSHPFNLHYYMQEQSPGEHKLTIIVEDDIGNKRYQDVKFSLSAEEVKSQAIFQGDYSSIEISNFPKAIVLKPIKLESFQKVSLYYEQGINKNLIGEVTNFGNLINNQLIINWREAPAKGQYKLIAETLDQDDNISVTSVNTEIK